MIIEIAKVIASLVLVGGVAGSFVIIFEEDYAGKRWFRIPTTIFVGGITLAMLATICLLVLVIFKS